MRISRRAALGSMGAAGAVAAAPAFVSRAFASDAVSLSVQNAAAEIIPGTTTQGLFSTRPDGPPPVIEMRQGVPFSAAVTNNTDEYTAMHWHGIRVPNSMDGVPYLTQFPIAPGETFDYAFTPEDAGTHWYHPHCMTMDQMAMGFTGVLVVKEREDPGFDADITLNLRDFRLGGDGQFIDLWTARGAARAGTKGTIRTANWSQMAEYEAPAGGLTRLRIVATDTARIYRVYLPRVRGRVIAMDGHPVEQRVPFPGGPEQFLELSPGQRVDLAIEMPSREGAQVDVMVRAPRENLTMAKLSAVGADSGRNLRELRPLPRNPLSVPDLSSPRFEEFVFGWTPEGGEPNNGLCGTLGYTFWSINRTAWAGDAAQGTAPLATFRRGENVVMRLRNESPNAHPIHLHGLTFVPIRSNQRELPRNWTDTALLKPEETIDIAFVADNPGDWAFHCHVIEHQKTGLAGFIRVE